MPSKEWNSLTRVYNWQEQILDLKLGQRLRLENITRDEFVKVFPTLLERCLRVTKIERTTDRHFNVFIKNLLVRHHSKDLPFLLAQMGSQ